MLFDFMKGIMQMDIKTKILIEIIGAVIKIVIEYNTGSRPTIPKIPDLTPKKYKEIPVLFRAFDNLAKLAGEHAGEGAYAAIPTGKWTQNHRRMDLSFEATFIKPSHIKQRGTLVGVPPTDLITRFKQVDDQINPPFILVPQVGFPTMQPDRSFVQVDRGVGTPINILATDLDNRYFPKNTLNDFWWDPTPPVTTIHLPVPRNDFHWRLMGFHDWASDNKYVGGFSTGQKDSSTFGACMLNDSGAFTTKFHWSSLEVFSSSSLDFQKFMKFIDLNQTTFTLTGSQLAAAEQEFGTTVHVEGII